MVLGSLMLYEAPETGFRISWWVILPTVGATAGLVAWVVSAGLKALYRRPSTGLGDMIGRTGVARMALEPEGQVQVGGELWRAVVDDGRWPRASPSASRRRGIDARGAGGGTVPAPGGPERRGGRASARGDGVRDGGCFELLVGWPLSDRDLRDRVLGADSPRVRARGHLPLRPAPTPCSTRAATGGAGCSADSLVDKMVKVSCAPSPWTCAQDVITKDNVR